MQSRSAKALLVLTCVAIGSWSASSSAAQDFRPRIVYQEQVTNFFGGADAVLHFEIHAAGPVKGLISWQIHAAERKVVSRELQVEIEADGPATIVVRHKFPPVKDGIVFPLELTVAFVPEGETAIAAQWKEALWLFPESPFTDRSERLASLRIHLFDPEGTTAAALKKLEVPFTPVRNLAAVADLKPGIFIVGENVSWAAQRNLAPQVLELAASGTPVLCLAPADGSLPLPLAAAADQPSPGKVAFRRTDTIRELDKRLGDQAWVAGKPLVARELIVASERQALVAQFADPGGGWPWLEIGYGKSKLVWCGLGVVRDWDQSPTPRFLLARLLESLPLPPPPVKP